MYGRLPELLGSDEQRIGHSYDDEQDLFPERPILPRHMRKLCDLVGRPRPDEMNEPEDLGNAPLQELQKLIENLLHGRTLLGPARQTVSIRKPNIGKRFGQGALAAGNDITPSMSLWFQE